MRDHGRTKLPVKVEPVDRLQVSFVGDFNVVGEIVFRHGEQPRVEEDETGVGGAGAFRNVNNFKETASVEEDQASNAGVAVELADGFRVEWLPR